ncbi:MAG: transposase, partial [Chitinivibrionales bacterium]|nr:transposase [Chitinivibrionales bacterium]
MQLLSVKAKYYCGIDLHARSMYLCVTTKAGTIKYHQELTNDATQFLAMVKPFLPSIVVGVESTYNWYWLADICTAHKIPFHVGHALYIKRFTARKQANDRIDSRSIAELLRTNRFPLAYGYPREMRITRDLLRRRHMFVRRRAGTYTHMQNSFTQYGQFESVYDTMRSKTERQNLPPRFDDDELRFNAERDCDYLDALDSIIWKLNRRIRKQAVYHDPV